MKCSPHYHGKERLDNTPTQCNDKCFHYPACLEELDLPADWSFPQWVELEATETEIIAGKYHIKKGQKVKWFNLTKNLC